jgi:hypothetical protein
MLRQNLSGNFPTAAGSEFPVCCGKRLFDFHRRDALASEIFYGAQLRIEGRPLARPFFHTP